MDKGVAQELIDHVSDSNVFDLFPGVPGIKLPSFLTDDVLMIWLAGILITAVAAAAVKKLNIRVKGPAAWMEFAVVFIRDDIVVPSMGEKRGEKWLPFFSTLFLFLLTLNLLGLFPAFKTATGNMSVTTALSCVIMTVMFAAGFRNLGFSGFFKNLYPSGTPLPIAVFVFFLEFTGLFIKSVILSLRLFANMFAGHLAILSFLVLICILHPLIACVSVPLALFTYLLEILVAVVQALVFTLLSCIFISLASTGHESEEHT